MGSDRNHRSSSLLLRAGYQSLFACLFTLGCSSGSDGEPDGGSGMGGTAAIAGSAGSGGVASGGSAQGQAGTLPMAGKASGGQAGAGQGGAAQAGGGGGGAAPGGAGSGQAGAAGGGSTTPEVHYVGRVDTSDPKAAKFAWSGTGAVVRFNGTTASVDLKGGQEYTVVVDDMVQPKLTAKDGVNTLATGLSAADHTIELYRRTEAAQGESQILGFDFGGGKLLAPPPVTRRLEFIGDSITCGYGNEGPNESCSFTPQTENHYLSYAAITARNLQAELSTVAWSGKGVVCNYGDDASSCMDPLPTYYDRILPNQANSVWDFSRFQPDAVVVNLGTNDLSTNSDPDQATFVGAYKMLLGRIRKAYPAAHILCTNGSMLSGTDLTNVRLYIQDAVTAVGDPKITTFELQPQNAADGLGCDYHPSLETHKKMATVVTAAIKTALGW